MLAMGTETDGSEPVAEVVATDVSSGSTETNNPKSEKAIDSSPPVEGDDQPDADADADKTDGDAEAAPAEAAPATEAAPAAPPVEEEAEEVFDDFDENDFDDDFDDDFEEEIEDEEFTDPDNDFDITQFEK